MLARQRGIEVHHGSFGQVEGRVEAIGIFSTLCTFAIDTGIPQVVACRTGEVHRAGDLHLTTARKAHIAVRVIDEGGTVAQLNGATEELVGRSSKGHRTTIDHQHRPSDTRRCDHISTAPPKCILLGKVQCRSCADLNLARSRLIIVPSQKSAVSLFAV